MNGILNGGPAIGPFRLMYMTRERRRQLNQGSKAMHTWTRDSSVNYLGHKPPRQAEKSRRLARWTSPQETPEERRLVTGECWKAMSAAAQAERWRC